MQIYGIDLAKEKFDVSFLHQTSKMASPKPKHKVIKNNAQAITSFLKNLPENAVLVAEHTGVYGDTLLKLCTDMNVKIAYVNSLTIHTYKCAPDRGKTDEKDCYTLREFGERFLDKLIFTKFPSRYVYELRQLSNQRAMLEEERKRIRTKQKAEECRPIQCGKVIESLKRLLETMDCEIAQTERDIRNLINEDKDIANNFNIITSIPGVGLVTALELIIKSQNFTTISTAREYAAYAGIAPYEKSSGKMNAGAHISKIGNRRSKNLLYICADSARKHNKEIKLYYDRRKIIEKKHHFYTLNAIANKLLRIIFTLISKNERFDKEYICNDPRKLNKN